MFLGWTDLEVNQLLGSTWNDQARRQIGFGNKSAMETTVKPLASLTPITRAVIPT